MSETLTDTGNVSIFTLALIAVAVLVCLGLLFWLVQRRSHMAFIRGGANRQPRLAVLDAAAVDARRRLVLIRRDNVEHLIMIGGPSDVVIESGIGLARREPATQQKAAAAPPKPHHDPKPAVNPSPTSAPARPADGVRSAAASGDNEAAVEPSKAPVQKQPPPAARGGGSGTTPKPPTPQTTRHVEHETAEPARKRDPAGQRPSTPQKPPEATVRPDQAPAASAAVSESAAGHRRDPVAETGFTAATARAPATAEPQVGDAGTDVVAPEPDAKAEFEDVMDAVRELAIPVTTPSAESPPAPEPDLNAALATPGGSNKASRHSSRKSSASTHRQNATRAEDPAPVESPVSPDDLVADIDRALEAEMSKIESPPSQQSVQRKKENPPRQYQDAEADLIPSLEDEMKKLLDDFPVEPKPR